MDVCVNPAPLGGTVAAVPSKSQAHRALICAALANAPTFIECGGESQDIAATADCLRALGAGVERVQGGYSVTPLDGITKRTRNALFSTKKLRKKLILGILNGQGVPLTGLGPSRETALGTRPVGLRGRPQRTLSVTPELPCGESGSTLRFLLPIVGALGKAAAFLPLGRLPQRPLAPLDAQLAAHGMTLSPAGSVPFFANGRLLPGRYELDGGVSSQFVSGLLFALPLLDGDSELHINGKLESFPYIELTLAMLEEFGINISFDGARFAVCGAQEYRSPGTLRVEGDWSNAAFWLCAGAMSAAGITVTGLNPRSRQGDRAVLDILERFGANLIQSGDSVTVSRANLRGADIDAADIPDLVPILSVVAAAAEGVTTIRNAKRLRIKESDRLHAMTSVLRALGADVSERPDGLVIRGGPLSGGCVSSFGDHRIAMSAAIAACVCAAPVEIQRAGAVAKSYPRFFEDLGALGGDDWGTLGALPLKPR